jgi:hypothetical protein
MESEEPRQRPLPDEDADSKVEAVVVETSADARALLRLEDGSEQQLSAPEEMSELLRPGLRVILYHGPDDELLGWYLPEHEIGLDLR